MTFHVPDDCRLTDHPHLASTPEAGNNGFFCVHNDNKTMVYAVQASDGGGWEHISVSLLRVLPNKMMEPIRHCPTWGQMCAMKSVFWDAEDIVLQFHPAASDYRNLHEFTLHLWRPIDVMFPCPPPEMIA